MAVSADCSEVDIGHAHQPTPRGVRTARLPAFHAPRKRKECAQCTRHAQVVLLPYGVLRICIWRSRLFYAEDFLFSGVRGGREVQSAAAGAHA